MKCPIDGGASRKSALKRKSTPNQSGQKKQKNSNLVMAGPAFGLAQFKI